MRVLLYAHHFHPSVGGAEMAVRLLAEGLVARGHQVEVATATAGDDRGDGGFPFAVARRPRLSELWHLIGRADVVHLAGPVFLPLALALIRRKATVIEHHGYQAVCPNGLLLQEPQKTACPGHFMAGRYGECMRCLAVPEGVPRGLAKLLLSFPRRWMAGRAAVNLVITGHVGARLQLPRTRVAYYGVRDSGVSRAPGEGGTETAPAFAYVGRLVSEKGLPLLIDAAAILAAEGRAFRLKFVGDGPERRRLETAAAAAGLLDRTEFTGFLAGSALDRALEDVTAVVMPSIWEETAGLAAIEHMMRGRPVVAAEIGGLGEVVGSAGLKFPPGNTMALTDRLRRLLDEPDLASELGVLARQRAAETFAYERMIEQHLETYHALATGRPRSSVSA